MNGTLKPSNLGKVPWLRPAKLRSFGFQEKYGEISTKKKDEQRVDFLQPPFPAVSLRTEICSRQSTW